MRICMWSPYPSPPPPKKRNAAYSIVKVKCDHRSKFSNLSNWKVEAWKKKKNQGFNGIRTHDLRDTGAMLYQLSYEATHWEQGQFIEFISSRAVKSCEIYMKYFIFVLRYGMKVKCDHRSKFSNLSNWKVEACDDHTSLSSHTAVQIWIISYIFHMISLHGKKWTQ